jgi:hypothetical protein
MDGKDPFDYSITQYLWVVGIACIAGLVKHINNAKKVNGGKFLIDLITAGFTGVLTFWLCESINIHGPISAILIATGGLMGNRAWFEFENFWRVRFGIPIVVNSKEKLGVPVEKEEKKSKKSVGGTE